jgi:hypothetical protein
LLLAVDDGDPRLITRPEKERPRIERRAVARRRRSARALLCKGTATTRCGAQAPAIRERKLGAGKNLSPHEFQPAVDSKAITAGRCGAGAIDRKQSCKVDGSETRHVAVVLLGEECNEFITCPTGYSQRSAARKMQTNNRNAASFRNERFELREHKHGSGLPPA